MTNALLAVVALVAAYVQATAGLGFGLILSPVLLAVLAPEEAIVTVMALGIELNLLVLLAERRRPRVAWGEVGPIVAAVVPGSVCGLLVLRAVPKPGLQIGVGLAVIAAGLLHLQARSTAATPGTMPLRLALGFATGVLALSIGVNGPPLALWLSRRGLEPSEVRDSLCAIFLGTAIIGAVVLVPVLDQKNLDLRLLATAFGAVLAGHALGSRSFKRLDPEHFELLLHAVIIATGTVSLVIGAWAL